MYSLKTRKRLAFYTVVLGFLKKRDLQLGEGRRGLTVVAPGEPEGTELLLEPSDNPAARAYMKAIFKQGIPAHAFLVDDVPEEYGRLKRAGVRFTMNPTTMGPVVQAIFDDTCGNLIQIYCLVTPSAE